MADSDNSTEKRLRYGWPVWFAEDFSDVLSQGQMVDIASDGASFTCYADKCPCEGQHITARFSVPRYGTENSFDLENFVRSGNVQSVGEAAPFVKTIELAFSEPLPFKPGEIDDTEALQVEETVIPKNAPETIIAKSVETKTIVQTEAEAMADAEQLLIEESTGKALTADNT